MAAVRKKVFLAAIAGLLFAANSCRAANAAATIPASPQRAPLTLFLNGVEKAIAIVILRDDDALVTERELADAGVPIGGARYVSIDGKRYVSIQSLAPSVTFSIDTANLILKLQADPKLLPRTTTSLGGENDANRVATADPSGFLNYALSGNTIDPNGSRSGFVQAGIGNAAGLFLASGSYANGLGRRGLISFQSESQQAMHRITLGDEVAESSILGGSAIVGGIGFTRHFEFQPRYAYFPTANISGTALTPVTADIYVNGSFLRSVQLPPGQFDFTNLPLPSGANLTQVVLHDASGNTKTLGGVIYQPRGLLAKGVSDYNYHVGFVRPNPFGNDDRYGSLAALGTYRVGLTEHVTSGIRFERTGNVLSGGPQIDVGLPLGQVSLEGGLSAAEGSSGSAFGAAYDLQLGRFALELSALTFSAHYATTSLTPDAARTRSTLQQSISIPLPKKLTLALSHTTSTFSNAPTADQLVATIAMQLRKGIGFSLNAERDRGSSILGAGFHGLRNTWLIGTSMSFNLSPGSSLFAQALDSDGAKSSSFTLSKSAPNGPGFGYIVRGSGDGGASSASADLNYQTQYADVSALLSSGAGRSSATFVAGGSLIGFKQGLFFSRPVANSYSLADAAGFPNLPIFLGEIYQGHTDRRGALVVPVLEGYGENHLIVGEVKDAPDVMEDQPSAEVHPKAYQGVVVPFAVRTVRAYVGRVVVHRRGAEIIPAFARLFLNDARRQFVSDLGSTGQFYLENLPQGSYAAALTGRDGLKCDFTLALPATKQALANLGAFDCEAAP